MSTIHWKISLCLWIILWDSCFVVPMHLLNFWHINRNKTKWYFGFASNHYLDNYFQGNKKSRKYCLNKFFDVTRLLLLLEDTYFIDLESFLIRSKTVNIEKMFYTFPLCLYSWSSWSSCENRTIVDDYDEKFRLCIPWNCIGDTQRNLKTFIPVLKMFVTLALEVSYAPFVTTINMINRKILTLVWLPKNPKRDSS